MFDEFRRESESLMKSAISLIYFMRGSISFDDVMMVLTPGVKQQMLEFIEKRLEMEGKKMNPVY